jgi:hypothetical protein
MTCIKYSCTESGMLPIGRVCAQDTWGPGMDPQHCKNMHVQKWLVCTFLCYFKSKLLRNNLLIIKCTNITCTIQWILINVDACATIPQ